MGYLHQNYYIKERQPMKYYAGLDVSMASTSICVIDAKGKIVREGEVESTPTEIAKFIVRLQLDIEAIGLESGPLSPFLHRELSEFGLPTVCVDARHLSPFLSVKVNKTDKNDARGIAEAMRCGAYKEVHSRSSHAITCSSVLGIREALVEARVKLTNTVRGILKPHGIRSLGSAASYSTFSEKCIEAIEQLPSELKTAIRALLSALKEVYAQIKALDSQVKAIVMNDDDCVLLQSAPGVGPVTALCFKHCIDDLERFQQSKSVGAYIGLTPSQYSSGETTIQGRISKKGSKRLRRLLVESATVILTRTKYWSKLKAWGIKISRKKGLRKAAVAVARKLGVILFRMLKTRETFQRGEPKAA